jgi:hypothetical protein
VGLVLALGKESCQNYTIAARTGIWSTRETLGVLLFYRRPWARLPDGLARRYDSAWVTGANTLYDPQLGHPLYNRYLLDYLAQL